LTNSHIQDEPLGDEMILTFMHFVQTIL